MPWQNQHQLITDVLTYFAKSQTNQFSRKAGQYHEEDNSMAMAKQLRILPIELDSLFTQEVLRWLERTIILIRLLFLLMVNH